MRLAPCPPATFFVTLRLADRRSDLLVRQIDAFRLAMRGAMQRMPFAIDAITVMPALTHMILALPPEAAADAKPPVQTLKRRFVQLVAPDGRAAAASGAASLWHRDSWICPLTTALDRARHRTLIYHAPVEAGLCARPQDWLHSSLHRDLRIDGDVTRDVPQQARATDHSALPAKAVVLT